MNIEQAAQWWKTALMQRPDHVPEDVWKRAMLAVWTGKMGRTG